MANLAIKIVFICGSSAALSVWVWSSCVSTAWSILYGTCPVAHHYSLDGIVVLLLDAFSFASTLELFILIESPRCNDEKSIWMRCVCFCLHVANNPIGASQYIFLDP
ncbi:hypothetical protein BDR07DRAFT_643181 [Suillus spraguei]|nr:hypothetical protein BDR07DRAFT_643181 [Suillus spraguei]